MEVEEMGSNRQSRSKAQISQMKNTAHALRDYKRHLNRKPRSFYKILPSAKKHLWENIKQSNYNHAHIFISCLLPDNSCAGMFFTSTGGIANPGLVQ